ncbi:MAG TPA: hypothetical protein VD971_05935 [Phycisphaerales bacterium]|nr:hypothetical protein [Phycisphaerales bacterium]
MIDRKRGPGGPVFYCDHELATKDKATGKMVPSMEIADESLESWLKRLKYGSAGLPKR